MTILFRFLLLSTISCIWSTAYLASAAAEQAELSIFESSATTRKKVKPNHAPTLKKIASKKMHWRDSSSTVKLVGKDKDGDLLTYTAELVSEESPPVELKLSDNILTIKLLSPYSGAFEVLAAVSDGQVSDSSTFSVEVHNKKPHLNRIPDQRINDKTSIQIKLKGNDADKDPLTFTAKLLNEIPNLSLDLKENTLLLSIDGKLKEDAAIKVSLSDGLASVSQDFRIIAEKSDNEPEKIRICHIPPGSPEDKHTIDIGENALQAHLAHGDSLGSCSDDDDGGDQRVVICHSPPDNKDISQTLIVGKELVEGHLLHGDILGECAPVECEIPFSLRSPAYGLWNGFLEMANILELTNSDVIDSEVTLSLYSVDGELSQKKRIPVPALTQRDVILSDLSGFVRDSYGIIKLEFEGQIDGRLVYYRESAYDESFDFLYTIPLLPPRLGVSAVNFNTIQPSRDPLEQENLVTNWLSIVNLADTLKIFTIVSYDSQGVVLDQRLLEVPPLARIDIDGGHGIAGAGEVGLHTIHPDDVTAPYVAKIVRFGGDAPPGIVPESYEFAFPQQFVAPLVAKSGTVRPLYAPIKNVLDQDNWIEVVNTLGEPVSVTLAFHNSSGNLRESTSVELPAYGQQHFNAAFVLGFGESGTVSVLPNKPKAILAQSMFYRTKSLTGSIEAVYGVEAREGSGCAQAGSYNTFLGMQNLLTLMNPSSSAVRLTVQTSYVSGPSEKTYELQAHGELTIELQDPGVFQLPQDSYGLIQILTNNPSVPVAAELLRMRVYDEEMDFAIAIPVR